MLEKVIFVDRERLSSCSILNPSFLEISLGEHEYFNSKNNIKVLYLHVQFDNSSFRIFDGSNVRLEAVISGKTVEYMGGSSLLEYFDFLVDILPEVGNSIGFPQYLVFKGNSEVSAPAPEEDPLAYEFNVFSVDQTGTSGSLPIDLSWDTPVSDAIEIEVEGDGVFKVVVSPDFDTEDGEEVEFTATVVGVSPTLTATFKTKIVKYVAPPAGNGETIGGE